MPTSSPPAALLAAGGVSRGAPSPPSDNLTGCQGEPSLRPVHSPPSPNTQGTVGWLPTLALRGESGVCQSSAPSTATSREPLIGRRTGGLHPCPRLSFSVSPPQPRGAAPARAVHGPRRAPRPRARPRSHLPQVRAAPAAGHQPRRRPPAPPPPARASLRLDTPSKKTPRVFPPPSSIKEVFFIPSALCPRWATSDPSLAFDWSGSLIFLIGCSLPKLLKAAGTHDANAGPLRQGALADFRKRGSATCN